MAPLLLRHLAASLVRQVSHMRTLSFSSSPAASAFRCLRTLAAAPRTLLPSPGKIMGSVRAPLSGSSAPCGPSLLGQCQHLPCIQPSAGMKTKSALKRRCKDCFFARRRGRLFVFCKANPRHKQRQG